MGLEMRAERGQLVYLRRTGRIDEGTEMPGSMDWPGPTDPYDSLADAAHEPCDKPPAGWFCTRLKGHEGPCAAHKYTSITDGMMKCIILGVVFVMAVLAVVGVCYNMRLR